LINFEKMRLVAKEIRGLTAMCSAPLRNVPDNVIAMNENEQLGKNATMRRKVGARNAPDARRMYNEALMVRKVKAYLENVMENIIEDEDILKSMSAELEPNTNKLSMMTSSSSIRSGGRPPSPTPSKSSNLSEGKKSVASGTGKFGASSPERERKLLSLAESGPSTRKTTKVSKSSYSLSVASQSPGPSPGLMRRDGHSHNHGGAKSHERSHSDTPPVPVGLTAESSSVASLPGLRRGSVSSQDSQEDRRLRSQERQEDRRGKRSGLELPPRAGGPPPPRPPDYQTAVRHRVARTQSRDNARYSDDETQVSAV